MAADEKEKLSLAFLRPCPFTSSRCYGSIASPVHLGSGGSRYESKGGGALRLTIAGALAHNGAIRADGRSFSTSAGSQYYGAAGGSVWIEAGSIRGGGSIPANGGGCGNSPGAGGRVALYLTDEGETLGATPSVTAYGGHYYSDGFHVPAGSPGTIYEETAADGARRGTVLVANHASASAGTQYVDFPSTLAAATDDGRDATWRLSGCSYLYITRDAKVADVSGSKARSPASTSTATRCASEPPRTRSGMTNRFRSFPAERPRIPVGSSGRPR